MYIITRVCSLTSMRTCASGNVLRSLSGLGRQIYGNTPRCKVHPLIRRHFAPFVFVMHGAAKENLSSIISCSCNDEHKFFTFFFTYRCRRTAIRRDVDAFQQTGPYFYMFVDFWWFFIVIVNHCFDHRRHPGREEELYQELARFRKWCKSVLSSLNVLEIDIIRRGLVEGHISWPHAIFAKGI